MDNKKAQSKKEVGRLLIMLFLSVLLALGVVYALVSKAGASGTVVLKEILVSPKALESISFADIDPSTGQNRDFVFNKLEFTVANASGKGWGRFAVSVPAYTSFYTHVKNKRSLPKLTDEQIEQFDLVSPSTLTLFIQEKGSSPQFQQIEFLDKGDLFRVRQPQAIESADEWVYFKVSGIYHKVMELFAPEVRY